MKAFPTSFSDEVDILGPDYDSKTNQALSDLADRGFVILHGLTAELSEQIYRMAREKHIREYCPRDCTEERFGTTESTARWLSKGQAFFMLAKKTDSGFDVVGYGWSAPKETDKIPRGQTTFAVRLGEAGLGQRLSLPFCKAILGATTGIYGVGNFWLETWASNAGAVHLYEELGFEKVTEVRGGRTTTDGLDIEDTRLFMDNF
jgi:hypothetical protein